MEFKGIITDVIETSGTFKKTGENFTAYKIRMEEKDSQYPNSICLDLFGDKLQYKVGQEGTAIFYTEATLSEDKSKMYGKNKLKEIKIKADAF